MSVSPLILPSVAPVSAVELAKADVRSIEKRSLNGSNTMNGTAVCEIVDFDAPEPRVYEVSCGAMITALLFCASRTAGSITRASVARRKRIGVRSSLRGDG